MKAKFTTRSLGRAPRVLLAAGALLAAQSGFAGIAGTAHDFSLATNSSSYQTGTKTTQFATSTCTACHTPHGGAAVSTAPAWARTVNTKTYKTYQSSTFNKGTAAAQPGPSSLLCLSCHDGAQALNTYTGSTYTTAQYINPGNRTAGGTSGAGTDVSGTHPIGFDYSAVITADGRASAYKVATSAVTVGSGTMTKAGTFAAVLLRPSSTSGPTMECESCHDVHATYSDQVSPKGLLLQVNGSTGAQICSACHNF